MKARVCIRNVVQTKLPLRKKLTLLKQILSHEYTKTVLDEYPIDTFIPAMRLMARLMRHESAIGVYILMKVRESARGVGWFKSVLKRMGVGR